MNFFSTLNMVLKLLQIHRSLKEIYGDEKKLIWLEIILYLLDVTHECENYFGLIASHAKKEIRQSNTYHDMKNIQISFRKNRNICQIMEILNNL
jgi:hypothetical protein